MSAKEMLLYASLIFNSIILRGLEIRSIGGTKRYGIFNQPRLSHWQWKIMLKRY